MRILKIAAAITLIAFSAHAQDANLADQFPVAGENTAEPQEVVRSTHGAWEIRCSGESDNCFMYQLLINGEGTPLAEFSMIKLPAGSEAVAGATVVAPLGTLLTRGLVIQIDENEAQQYPFSWCTRPGCFARFGLTDLLVSNMRSGTDLKVAVFSIADPQKPVEVSASLEGFTAAFEALPNQSN